MLSYAIQRIVQLIPVLIVMSMIVFGVILLIPGDPVLVMIGPAGIIDPVAVAALRHTLGLDQPIPVQYVLWVTNAFHGNLGQSVQTREPVVQALVERLPVTLELALLAAAFAMLVALPLGILSGVKPNTAWDWFAIVISTFGLSIPGFWLAILMVLVFAVRLHWLRASGFTPFFDDPVANLTGLIMPAVALGVVVAGVLTRQVRSSVLEAMSQDYVRTARAKGASTFSVVVRHALPNAAIAPLTVLGLNLAQLLGGSIIIEQIFRIPGVGLLMVNAITARDFQVVQGGTLVLALIVVTINLSVDLLYGVLDPRIARS